MTILNIDGSSNEGGAFPNFSLTIHNESITAIYSDIDLQEELANRLTQIAEVTLFDYKDGLYERITVQENIKFYHQWFGCGIPLSEVLVLFGLQHCARQPLKECTVSEIRRVYYAKHYMTDVQLHVFQEPISGVDILTVNTFMTMIDRMKNDDKQVLILVSNMEHALMLGEAPYRLQSEGLQMLETETQSEDEIAVAPTSFSIEKLFKVTAKIEDKVILFDPTEIDYIESQDGKSMIVINNETFPLDSTLSEIEKKLELYGFYRCHRSYIVNLQKVREIITWSKNTYSLRMNNQIQSTIPLSRTKIQAIQEIFKLK